MLSQALNLLILSKLILWVIAVVAATWMLSRCRLTPRLRFVLLIFGTLVFGFVYGIAVRPGANPNPVLSLRNVLAAFLTGSSLVPVALVMLAALLLMVFVSNKSICGWGCQLGLAQDLIYRLPLPKWRPPFWLSNSARAFAFFALIGGLAWAGIDWIKGIDPFAIFALKITAGIGVIIGAIFILSAVIYRPWCQFFCPFGLVGWVVEQVSLLRPRIDRERCTGCEACVRACPTRAMADFYEGKTLHADCFACGACISACRQEALRWTSKSGKGGAE